MKLVVLDGYALNPGDLSWAPIQALGQLTVHERTPLDPPNTVIERSTGAAALLTNKTVLNATTIAALPDLRYIGVLATGYNVVDVSAAKARGIVVTNVPAYSTDSVAQWTIALLLELASQVGRHNAAVQQGQWTRSADFCFWQTPLLELSGLTLGLVGVGSIGSQVARIASALGMTVIGHSRSGRVPQDVRAASLEDLLRQADVVSLHCPLTPETHHLINAPRLALMKPTALLINTARGDLVDEAALAEALSAGRLAGAAVDVLSQEPPPADNPLLRAPHTIITPHIAWASSAARARLLHAAAGNLRQFQAGHPVNVVS